MFYERMQILLNDDTLSMYDVRVLAFFFKHIKDFQKVIVEIFVSDICIDI